MRLKKDNHELNKISFLYKSDKSFRADDPTNSVDAPTNGASNAPTNSRSNSRANAPTNSAPIRSSASTTFTSSKNTKKRKTNPMYWVFAALVMIPIVFSTVSWGILGDGAAYLWYYVLLPYIMSVIVLVAFWIWYARVGKRDGDRSVAYAGVFWIVITLVLFISSVYYVCTKKQDSVDLYDNGLFYSIKDDGTLQLERPNESTPYQIEKLVIPEEVNGKPVTSINNCGENRNLKEIVLPSTVKEIKAHAFSGCSGLVNVTLADGVTYIGEAAFSGCTSLVSITIPDSVTYIGENAFNRCEKLESITLPFVGDSAKSPDDINQFPLGYLFGEADNYYEIKNGTQQKYLGENPASTSVAVYKIPSSLKSVTITGNVIPYGAFFNCSNLTNVYLSDNITSIGDEAFYGCDALQYNVYDNANYLGNSDNPYAALLSLSSNAISTCAINKGTKVIADKVFSNCSQLTNVYYTGSVSNWCNVNFCGKFSNPLCNAKNLYINGELVTSVTLDDTATTIKDFAFYNYKQLTSVTTSNSVNVIGDKAFYDCAYLANVTFGNGLKSIGDEAFYNCYSLISISLPDGVVSIGDHAFDNCISLQKLTLGNSLQSIGKYAFYNCYFLNNDIVIPDSIVTISNNAFEKCESVKSITIGAGVQHIENNVFSDCPLLKSINYNGVMENWFLVEKDANWNGSKVITKVVCADGTIDLQ